MFWKPHFFKKSSENAYKEFYFSYYLNIYIPVQWLIQNRKKAEEITDQTLLQVCCDSNMFNEDTLLVYVRRIAKDKCLDYIKKDASLKDKHAEYLGNDEHSADLLEGLFNCVQLTEEELKEWKQLSPDQQDKMISDCTPPIKSIVRYYKWADLLLKYRERNITNSEEKELYRQAALSKAKQAQFEQFGIPENILKQLKLLNEIDLAQEFERFKKHLNVIRQPQVYHFRIMIAAAIFYTVLAVVYYAFDLRQISKSNRSSIVIKPNLATGKEPEFILQDGSVIKLDKVPDDVFIAPGMPFKKHGSTLAYVPLLPGDEVADPGINILSMPPRRQYQITLADGSVVDLNASSQLHFPVNFSKNERWVDMKGEAFFKVNANPEKPFFVNLKDQVTIKVTGTSFNIDAYSETDYIRTSLIEGHLQIISNGSRESKLLLPGQQVSFSKGRFLINNRLDVDQVMAWKNDWFYFDDKSIPEIMEEIGRWYKVKIIYNGKIPTGFFIGQFRRSNSLQDCIKNISIGMRIHIEITGDTLIVSK